MTGTLFFMRKNTPRNPKPEVVKEVSGVNRGLNPTISADTIVEKC